jgi:N-glycosylase/DNA lyase
MITASSEDKEKAFAYHTIHDFFDIYIMEDALHFLQTILKAAGTGKVWGKGYPFSAIFYMQHLEKLCTAAFYIDENYARRETAVIEKDKRTRHPGIELLQAATGTRRGENLWTCFPRSLTAQQFYDPYQAIKRFCRYQNEAGWKHIFTEIKEYALSIHRISDLHPPLNLLNIQRHLMRLIEACHLLEVRTNKKEVKN